MIDKIIDAHLEKQGFTRVPSSWTEDYRRIVEKLRLSNRTLREIGREYNTLLQEHAHTLSVKAIKAELKDIDISTTNIKGEELVELYVNTFAINFEDDTETEA